VYSLSGVVLIFRDTNFLKQERQIEKKLDPCLTAEQVGQAIRIRNLKPLSETSELLKFKEGSYDKQSGMVVYKVRSLPKGIEKLTHLHKASSKEPLFFLNVFFGVSLFFFVVSSFWMFLPSTSIFKKGLYFALAGIILTLILLFL